MGMEGIEWETTMLRERGKDSLDLTSVKLMITDNKPAIALLDMI
jgi:hypothetical protein